MSVTINRPRFTRQRPSLALRASQALVGLIVVLSTLLLFATPAGTASITAGEVEEHAPVEAAGFSGPVNSTNARFVVASYQTLLGRSPDTTGLDHHLDQITAGGDVTREQLTYGLLFSAEGSRQEVRRAYADILDRTPDGGGEDYWTEHLSGHGVVDLRVLLFASDEYHVKAGGSDILWLDRIYVDVLGRSADAGGRSYWLGQLAGGVPRALVVASIQLSDEALGRRADALYTEALGRRPVGGERTGAIGTIRQLGERGLKAQLWASDEVYERHLATSGS